MVGELQIPLWEWWIVGYFFLGGIAGGAYFTAAVVELVGGPEDQPTARAGYFLAFPLSLACVLFLILDLGQPLRFWHMLVYSRTLLPDPVLDAPMSEGAYALLVFSLFAFVSFVDALINRRRRSSGLLRKIFAIPGAILGLHLASYTGVLLAVTHLPVWANSPVLGALFAASAVATGMAAIALCLVLAGRERTGSDDLAQAKLIQADNYALILKLVLLIVLIVWLGSAAVPILTGFNGILLIGGTAVAGILLPLVLQFRSPGADPVAERGSRTMLTALLVLLGGFLMRTVIVMGGQALL